jgi:hypothetical protein
LLLQIRAAIREQLSRQMALMEMHGNGYSGGVNGRRRDKQRTKKCKFCLSKKEDDDIVTSHNLHDAQVSYTLNVPYFIF